MVTSPLWFVSFDRHSLVFVTPPPHNSNVIMCIQTGRQVTYDLEHGVSATMYNHIVDTGSCCSPCTPPRSGTHTASRGDSTHHESCRVPRHYCPYTLGLFTASCTSGPSHLYAHIHAALSPQAVSDTEPTQSGQYVVFVADGSGNTHNGEGAMGVGERGWTTSEPNRYGDVTVKTEKCEGSGKETDRIHVSRLRTVVQVWPLYPQHYNPQHPLHLLVYPISPIFTSLRIPWYPLYPS